MSISFLATWIIETLPSLLLGLFGLGFVIAFHEFGHFTFCKLFGVHVHSFSIGFGPQLIEKKIGSTVFKLSLIPVGGYVEAEAGQTEDLHHKSSIQSKSYLQQMGIVGGGIFYNLIFAYVVIYGLSLVGIPSNPFLIKNTNYSIEKILPNSAAEQAGLAPKDVIRSINGIEVEHDFTALLKELHRLPNKPAELIIIRDGIPQTMDVAIGSKTVKDKEQGTLGVEFHFAPLPAVSCTQAFIQAGSVIKQFALSMAQSLVKAFKKRSAENFAGPLMMISMTVGSAGQGISFFLLFLAFISVSLAVLNVLPLPILDGGQALIYTIEALIGRPLPESVRAGIAYVSWGLMLVIFGYLTFKDAIALFWS